MLRKGKKELIPGGNLNLKATPSASRKLYKVEGLSDKANVASLESDVQSKARWRVVRQKLSGGTSEGFVIFGEALVSFLKEDETVAFSQPYGNVTQYGAVDTSADLSRMLEGQQAVFWVFQPPAKLLESAEAVRYVFVIQGAGREGVPEGCSPVHFWLEEMDRAILESERRRYKLAKAGGLHNSVKAIGVSLPSTKAADVLAPTGAEAQSGKITSMFTLQAETPGASSPPSVLVEDRFPCAWIEWRGLLGGTPGSTILVAKDESILVVLVPMPAGVLIMNPSSDGNADFLGQLICIPWQRVKSHGSLKSGVVSFKAVPPGGQETPFIFRTPKGEAIDALFTKYIYFRAEERFPARWPPLRYDAADRQELDKPGVNAPSPRKLSPRSPRK